MTLLDLQMQAYKVEFGNCLSIGQVKPTPLFQGSDITCEAAQDIW